MASSSASPGSLVPFCGVLCLCLFLCSSALAQNTTDLDCTWWSKDYCQKSQDGTFRVSCDNGQMGLIGTESVYYHGVFSANIKLPKGYSGRTCTAFYLIVPDSSSNKDKNHFEIDFEFWGGQTERNIVLATNVFFAGRQNLAQFTLPFDPSEDFHKYTILWNHYRVIFLIDDMPIRVVHRYKVSGEPWPQVPMTPIFSQWVVDWSNYTNEFTNGPVTSEVRDFRVDGCQMNPSNNSWPPNASCPSWNDDEHSWNKLLDPVQWSNLQDCSYGWAHNATKINDWGWGDA